MKSTPPPPASCWTPGRIFAPRMHLHFSQAYFADCLSTSRASVLRWELGHTKPNASSTRALDQLARYHKFPGARHNSPRSRSKSL